MSDNKKSIRYALVSYLPKECLLFVLQSHIEQVNAYALINHNMDDAEPHYHIWLELYSSRKMGEILRWFTAFKDKGNTLIETMRNGTSCLLYLTHEDKCSRAHGKYQYPRELVITYNIAPNAWDSRIDAIDSSVLILKDMLSHASLYTLITRYGKEFVYHIEHFKTCANLLTQDDINNFLEEH